MFGRKKRKYVKKKSSKRSYKKRTFFSKFFNSIVAVVTISALILSIIILISKISELDITGINSIMSKIFTNFDVEKIKDIRMPTDDSVVGEFLPSKPNDSELLFKTCILSDIHQDEEYLTKAFEKIANIDCRNIFILGDISNYGDVESLKHIREVFNSFGVEFYALPGDHDIAQSLSPDNFNTVFGLNYHIVEYEGVGFLLLDNSANYTTIPKNLISWLESNIGNVDFVLLSQPLFTEGLKPPFSSTYMGSMLSTPESDDMREKQENVKKQRDFLLDLIRKNDNVRAIIAGDHHRSSKLEDSVRSGLTHYVVGAVTGTVNDFPQTAIQSSRFSVLSLYSGGDYIVEDVLID